MKLVRLASLLLITSTDVEASMRKFPAARIERPTKSAIPKSRSRVVLTTTLSPRTSEESSASGAVVVLDTSLPSRGSKKRTGASVGRNSIPETDPFITPTRPIATRQLEVSPSVKPSRRNGGSIGSVAVPATEDHLPRLRSSTSRSLRFDTPPRVTSASVSFGSLGGMDRIPRASDREESEDEDVIRASSSAGASKKRRVSSSPSATEVALPSNKSGTL